MARLETGQDDEKCLTPEGMRIFKQGASQALQTALERGYIKNSKKDEIRGTQISTNLDKFLWANDDK